MKEPANKIMEKQPTIKVTFLFIVKTFKKTKFKKFIQITKKLKRKTFSLKQFKVTR
jgi:hypothetical protein